MQARPQGRIGTQPTLDLQSRNLRRERGAARAREHLAAPAKGAKLAAALRLNSGRAAPRQTRA